MKTVIFFVLAQLVLCFMMLTQSPCEAKGAVDRLSDNLVAGISSEDYFLGREPENFDYEINKRMFWIGGKNGTRFFSSRTETGIVKDASIKKFATTIRMDEYGLKAGWRLGAMNNQSFAVGYGRKDIDPSDYIEYSYSDYCKANHAGGPCASPLGLSGIHSNPVYFDYLYDMRGLWHVSLSYIHEKIHLETNAGLSVAADVFTLSGGREWTRFALDFSLTKQVSDLAPDNTNLEMKLAYEPVRHIEISLLAGAYFNGLPAGGRSFSDLGERFVFNYLAGDSGFDKLYSEKFGYFALGVTLSL